jgi:hypothetical protein
MATIQDICKSALLEINVQAQGESLSAANAVFTLEKLNRILDAWNAEHAASYAQQFVTFTLTPSLSPHTIGPSPAVWIQTVRPVSIESASLILDSSTPSVYLPITLRDAQWWAGQQVPALETSFPTDCYYEPAWPSGNLYFWPVPTTAYDVELEIRRLLAQVALSDTFSLPPGYQEALTLTLAEQCARPFGRPLEPTLVRDAAMARARIFANNTPTPRLMTQDSGMPRKQSANFPTFNYLIGS